MGIVEFPRWSIAALIMGYQRWLSPLKGFTCAHRAFHGGDSCSEWGRKTVLEVGVLSFLALMYERLKDCEAAYAAMAQDNDDGEKNGGENGPEPCPCFNKESAVCCGSAMPCWWPWS